MRRQRASSAKWMNPSAVPAVEQVSCARLLGRFVFVACNLPEQDRSGADGCDRRFCKRAERGGRTAIFYFQSIKESIVPNFPQSIALQKPFANRAREYSLCATSME